MEYLKHKNAAFFHAAQYVVPDQVYYLDQEIIGEGFLIRPEPTQDYRTDLGNEPGYYGLVAIQIKDEGGYERTLYCPWPIVRHSRTRGAKRLREILYGLPDEQLLEIEDNHAPTGWTLDHREI